MNDVDIGQACDTLHVGLFNSICQKSITKQWHHQKDESGGVPINDMFYLFYLCLNYIPLDIYYLCGLEDICFYDGSWIFSKIEKQNAQASTFLIKVKSIYHTNNDQPINICNVNWRL